MNIIDLQERLKDLPENALMQEMQTPTGTAPQFLVLSELKRRKRMRDDYQRQEAQGMQTVAEEAITAASMPQEGIMGLAQGMAPRSAIAQDTGVNDMIQQDSVRAPQPEQPMMMADGGVLKMQPGGFTDRLRRIQEEGYLAFLNIMNLQDSPESREMYAQYGQTSAAAGGTMPDETRARLDLISRMTDPDSSFRNQLDQFSARLADFGTQPQPMGEAPQGIASISADVSSFLPDMPGVDSRPTMMAAPPVLGAAPTADGIDFDASDGPSVTQSRVSPTRMMMKADALDPRLDMVPGSALFRQQQQEVDDFNSRQREDDRLAQAQSNARLSNDPNDPTNVNLGDPDAIARAQTLRDAGITFSSRPPGVDDIIPSGGFGRGVAGFVERGLENRANRLLTQPPTRVEQLTSQYRQIMDELSNPDISENRRKALTAQLNTISFALQSAQIDAAVLTALGDAGGFVIDKAGDAGKFVIDAAGNVVSAFDVDAGERVFDFGDSLRGSTTTTPEEAANIVEQAALESSTVEDQGLSFGPDDGSRAGQQPNFPIVPTETAEDEVVRKLLERDADPVVSGGGGGGGGGGAGGFGPIESRIARMLEEREKSAEADKWLALAQTGLALMASDQPTLGGAIGEAGLAGIGAMQQARSQYDKDIMELLDMQAGVQRARSAGARSTAPKARTPAEFKALAEFLFEDVKRVAQPIYGPDPTDITGLKQTIVGYDYDKVPDNIMQNYIAARNAYEASVMPPVDVR